MSPSVCLPVGDGCWRGSNFIGFTFKEKIWLGKKKTKKILGENFKACGLAGLFVWVNEMRGQACHNPNAQRGNKFPEADLHNSIRNGPKGSVTKIILSDRLQALYFKLKTHSAADSKDKGNKVSAILLWSL